MSFDFTLNIGHLLTFLGIVGGGVGIYYGIRTALTILSLKIDLFAGRMINVENDIKDISKVLTAVAVQDQRVLNLEQRIAQMISSSEQHREWVRNEVLPRIMISTKSLP